MQSTTVVTNYYNDQLKLDIEREEKVLSGIMTREQADREESEWQEVRTSVALGMIYPWSRSIHVRVRVLFCVDLFTQ
jgi:hypothetical protein